jgi:membrane associated rhomboid family serine protease
VREREPIFNVPGVVLALVTIFAGVHVVRWLIPEGQALWLTAVLAFVPARLFGLAGDLPGGDAAAVTQFVTHIFLHGDLTHLIINTAWLLAFGSSVERRVGGGRFLAFFLLCGAAGALFYAFVTGSALSIMVGASGAISGLMGGALRFLFQALREGDIEGVTGEKRIPPLMTLRATLQDRRILAAIAGWTILNVLMAWGAAGLLDGASIAWEAHLGGFYAGLLTFGWFDRSDGVHHDAAPAA